MCPRPPGPRGLWTVTAVRRPAPRREHVTFALPQLAVVGAQAGGHLQAFGRTPGQVFFSKDRTLNSRMTPQWPPVSTLPVISGCSKPRCSSVHSTPSSMLPKTMAKPCLGLQRQCDCPATLFAGGRKVILHRETCENGSFSSWGKLFSPRAWTHGPSPAALR